ncbi:MAG: hypothetical protein VKJ46_12060, partial [Leptolyngbyaceae bacterium]|nr:hypothetical protein [Leptolyngbyaceae bacterium]
RRQELVTLMPLAAYIRPSSTIGGIGLPVHLGAQAYFDREKPSFIQEHADYIGLLLTLILLVGSWLWQLRSRFIAGQKNRADRYNLEIVELMEETYNQKDFKQITEARHKLFTIFKEVINDLDEDRITPESFQSFTFTWETAMAAVRDREALFLQKLSSSQPGRTSPKPIEAKPTETQPMETKVQ